MLKTILSISGKPGLYKLISQGRNMLIVESLTDKKRFPAYGNEKIISLGDIAMYTDTDDVPLKDVLTAMKEKENGAAVVMDLKKATADELRAYLGEVLPTFDRDRVYLADIKKLISWYNLLVACGITDFEDTAEAETTEEGKNKFKINCSFNRKGGLSGASRIIRFFLCGIFNFDYFFYTFVAILRCRVGGGLSHKD